MELQNEYTADSDDPTTDGYNNLFFRTEVAPTVQLNENFFVDGVIVWEDIHSCHLSMLRNLFEKLFYYVISTFWNINKTLFSWLPFGGHSVTPISSHHPTWCIFSDVTEAQKSYLDGHPSKWTFILSWRKALTVAQQIIAFDVSSASILFPTLTPLLSLSSF